MRKPFHLFLITALIVFLFLASLGFYLYTIHLITDQIREQGLRDINNLYAKAISNASREEFQALVLNERNYIPAHIIIVSEDYRLLADSHKLLKDVSGRYITADISEARRKGFAVKTVRSTAKGELVISISQVKKMGDSNIIIQLTYREKRIGEATKIFLIYFFSESVLISLLVYLLVLYSIKQYQKPIHSLIQNTRLTTGGIFSKISVDTGSTEILQIVENFNLLLDRYNLVIESDNKKYSRINTLLANMKAGILMVDLENNITLVNPRAEKLLNLNKVTLFKNPDPSNWKEGLTADILTLTKEVNSSGMYKEVTMNTPEGIILDISIQAVFNKYYPYEHNGALVFLQDVTAVRKLERLKDEFISNVSHELRTPLTVISGFIETIKSWELLSNDDRNTSINIIDIETRRLARLISELMFLSHIEGDMTTTGKTSFIPADIVKEAAEAVGPSYREKNQKWSLSIQGGYASMYGMESWFRQIIFNLCDNAAKYTPKNGEIMITLKDDSSEACIEVKDSGPGIPEEDRERIFDRFYRINKPSSSHIPGTGLGLAIVKQMTDEFNGTIEISDNVPNGSIFKVFIPYSTNQEKES